MAPELSSNWNKLRLQLASESFTNEQKRKRKLTVPTERQRNGLAKKRRLEGNGDSRAVTSSTAGRIVKKSKKEKMDESAELKGPSATLALWAEDHDISPQDLEDAYGHSYSTGTTAIPLTISDSINSGLISSVEIGKYIALDCEMVGVGGSEDRSVLARVSIVNFHGAQIYDSFVRPKEFVTDWRTHVSGISPRHMGTAREFEEVQGEVEGLLRDRVLVGHAVKNDLDALMLGHPKKDIRDTSKFSGFRKISAGRTPSLKNLVREILGVEIQAGEHSSIEDARATMLLFRKHKQAFDVEHAARFPTFAPGSSAKANKKKKKSKR